MYNYNIILIYINYLITYEKSGLLFSFFNKNHYITINILNTFIAIFTLSIIQRNLIFNILCIELLFISIILNFLIFSIYLVETLGQIFSMCLLALIAAESVISISLIIILFLKKGNIEFNTLITLK